MQLLVVGDRLAAVAAAVALGDPLHLGARLRIDARGMAQSVRAAFARPPRLQASDRFETLVARPERFVAEMNARDREERLEEALAHEIVGVV